MGDNDPRIVDRTERNAVSSFRDNASGPPVEQDAVTGRSNDTPVRKPEPAPLGGNTTFADRAKARTGSKAVKASDAEDKAVKPAAARKKG